MSKYQTGPRFEFTMPDAPVPLEGYAEFSRPDFAATPLNPYDLNKNGVSYVLHALDVINDVLAKGLDQFDDYTRPPEPVIALLSESVRGALFRRFDKNSGRTIPLNCSAPNAKLFFDSCLGTADENGLADLLLSHPKEIGSIELAKKSRPFKWDATAEMDGKIAKMLELKSFTAFDSAKSQNVSYYYMREDDVADPKAAIMVREVEVGHKSVAAGTIIVVQRDSVALSLSHPDLKEAAKEIVPWLQDDITRANMGESDQQLRYSGEVMSEFLNQQFDTPPDQCSASVYPGVRSYHAHYRAEEEHTLK